MNIVINILMFVVTSVLPIVVLCLAFLCTLWFLWLFWTWNADDLNNTSTQSLGCRRLFYETLTIDIGYFALTGWGLYMGREAPVLILLVNTFIAVFTGLAIMSFLFQRLGEKMIVP
jgi:TRAP-type C4-dicarboxylate transport system permease small subunit